MPKDNKLHNPSGLDSICLTPELSLSVSGYNSEYLKAMAAIEQNRKERKERIDAFINRYENNGSQSQHLKTLMQFQRQNAPSKTMRICHSIPIACIKKDSAPQENPITLNVNQYAYSLKGLNRCKNPYCIQCSRSKAGQRAHRIKNGIFGADAKGLRVLFATFTIPRQECIKTARAEISRRWKGLTELFHDWKKQYGITTYYTRALDVTFSKYVKADRYHLHIHSIIVLDADTIESLEGQSIDDMLIDRWISQNTDKVRCRQVSQNIQTVDLNDDSNINKVSKYVGKMAGLALEISQGTIKDAKSSTSSSLSDLMLDNTPLTRLIYNQFLTGMQRARTLQFSRNWDDLFIESDEENELHEYSINIPLDKWLIVRDHWHDIGEKMQMEIFQNSINASGDVDHYRIETILETVQDAINEASTQAEIGLLIYYNF